MAFQNRIDWTEIETGGVMIYISGDIPSKRSGKHVFLYDMEGLSPELNFKKCKWLLFGTYYPPSQADIY